MTLYLNTLNLANILKEHCPITSAEAVNPKEEVANQAWMHPNFLCYNYIYLVSLKTLYIMYIAMATIHQNYCREQGWQLG